MNALLSPVALACTALAGATSLLAQVPTDIVLVLRNTPNNALNFAIAAVLFAIAGRAPAGRELELANEIHGSAMEALQNEARGIQQQFVGMVHHPLNSALPLILVPLISIVVKSLKRSKAAPAAAATSEPG